MSTPRIAFVNDVTGATGSGCQLLWARAAAHLHATGGAELALASRYEGMPLAVLEALLCGRPCLLTDVAGHAEYVTEGENGFLAGAPTVASVAAALERAWQRRPDLPAMGRAAAERARRQIPPDPGAAFADELLALASGAKGGADA